MHRLEQQFSGQVDFIHLDIDRAETKPILQKFDVRRRSTYLLIDANGEILKAWTGYLDEATLQTEIEEILGKL